MLSIHFPRLNRVILLFCIFVTAGANELLARPRPPQPPLPELQLQSWHFDQSNWVEAASSPVLLTRNLTLVESWSGYALRMSGDKPRQLVIPTITESRNMTEGRTINLAGGAGSIRFWFSPAWASTSAGGTGPEGWARLLEVGRPNNSRAEFSMTLAVDPAGRRLVLSAQAEGEPVTYLDAKIAWASNAWHQVALVYSAQGVALVVDGSLAAASDKSPPWPETRVWSQLAFSFGSGLRGQDLAQGQLDNLTTFSFPLNAERLAERYHPLAAVAKLGPITDEEITQYHSVCFSIPSF